ncbi:hypothetical protein ACFY0Z_33375 [Streptomyces kronopolitis]|uniref:hypothetical protein n=1 Tax=Streptomyces kronopolitis TaxID=1612435 RepID=UPI0036813A26
MKLKIATRGIAVAVTSAAICALFPVAANANDASADPCVKLHGAGAKATSQCEKGRMSRPGQLKDGGVHLFETGKEYSIMRDLSGGGMSFVYLNNSYWLANNWQDLLDNVQTYLDAPDKMSLGTAQSEKVRLSVSTLLWAAYGWSFAVDVQYVDSTFAHNGYPYETMANAADVWAKRFVNDVWSKVYADYPSIRDDSKAKNYTEGVIKGVVVSDMYSGLVTIPGPSSDVYERPDTGKCGDYHSMNLGTYRAGEWETGEIGARIGQAIGEAIFC